MPGQRSTSLVSMRYSIFGPPSYSIAKLLPASPPLGGVPLPAIGLARSNTCTPCATTASTSALDILSIVASGR